MSINLVTYANQTVTPTNDAIIYEKAIDQNGIFYGCNVTVSGNNVNITGGYGIICGREFVIQSESIAVTLAPSGTLLGRLYVRLDLADADAPIQLLTATGESLPALEQDTDVNFTNGAYEMELATFDVGVSSLSNVAETFATIIGTHAVLDSGTISLAIGTIAGTARISVINGTAVMRWSVGTGSNLTSFTSGNSIGTIPEGFRPAVTDVHDIGLARTTGVWSSATYYILDISVESDGDIILRGNQTNIRSCQYLTGTIVYHTA